MSLHFRHLAGGNQPERTESSQRSITYGLGAACLLGLLLMLLSFARLIGDMNSAAFSFTVVEAALVDPIWKTRLALNVGIFFLTIAAIHLAFGVACWLLALATESAIPSLRTSRRQLVLAWFLACAVWLLVANANYFPRSSLGGPYHALVSTPWLGVSVFALATAALFCAMVAMAACFLYRINQWSRRGRLTAGAMGLFAVSAFGWAHLSAADHQVLRTPHVVLLGIDSLRPDLVAPETTPHVSAFMDAAVQLTDTVTPLARTFPAWTSILTGRHPHTTGAIMNLLPRDAIRLGTTLPGLLRQNGYRSYYAIDETRFSNIDASYGFDQTASPAIGASDFVISWFGDTPLSNFVVNTRLGAILFRHLHANRAAHVIYDPDTFVHRVGRAFDFTSPSFLAAHLTLPHWPYTWAQSDDAIVDESNTEKLYLKSVRRADQQFGDLLAMLQSRGVLDNAIVVALSDHGEALGHEDEFFTEAFPGGHEERNNFQRWGHGTSVFSPTQFHVVLGIRAFGEAKSLLRSPTQVDEPASLVDLAPTLLDLLGIEGTEPFDGVSLAHLIRPQPDASSGMADRIRFTETEYNPQGFSPLKIEKDMLALAAKVYRLDPDTDRILVRTEFMEPIMASRQYAALLGSSGLAAAIPGEAGYQLICIPDLSTRIADASPDKCDVREAMQRQFGITFDPDEQKAGFRALQGR